jgi:hypothetical protein
MGALLIAAGLGFGWLVGKAMQALQRRERRRDDREGWWRWRV